MCIAMGWPPEQPDGENPQPVIEEIDGSPYGGLIHRDLHEGNSKLPLDNSALSSDKYSLNPSNDWGLDTGRPRLRAHA